MSPADQVLSIDWSPDGNFFAVGTGSTGETDTVRIYEFEPINSTLTQVAFDAPGSLVNSY